MADSQYKIYKKTELRASLTYNELVDEYSTVKKATSVIIFIGKKEDINYHNASLHPDIIRKYKSGGDVLDNTFEIASENNSGLYKLAPLFVNQSSRVRSDDTEPNRTEPNQYCGFALSTPTSYRTVLPDLSFRITSVRREEYLKNKNGILQRQHAFI